MLVIDRFIFPNKGVSILKRFLISNWSKGLNIKLCTLEDNFIQVIGIIKCIGKVIVTPYNVVM